MSARDDAQALVTQLDALHASLAQAWLDASNGGDFAKAEALEVQADRAGDQLIAARQSLLAAIDSGKDISDLLAKMAGLQQTIQVQQAKITAGTADMTEVSGLLDTLGKVVAIAQTISGP